MNGKILSWALKSGAVLAFVALAGGLWYYTLGRKPKLVLSVPIRAGEQFASVHPLDNNEAVLFVGTKATLYRLDEKRDRWSVDLKTLTSSTQTTVAAATKASARPAATPAPEPAVEEKPDPLLVARVEKRFGKLKKWAGNLERKRASLKTKLQIDAFNEEAAKYHADLADARVEAAPLHRRALAAQAAEQAAAAAELEPDLSLQPGIETEIVADAATVWLVQGTHVVGLARNDGRFCKEVRLPSSAARVIAGTGSFHVLTPIAEGQQTQIPRVAMADGAAQSVMVAAPLSTPSHTWPGEGLPAQPVIAASRSVFSGQSGPLLQADAQLVERKVTERSTIAANTVQNMEEADRKTTGGWAADAMVVAQALENEAEREATGGKELIDESVYQVTVRRPFEPAIPTANVTMHGRIQAFSTPSLDLLVSRKEIVALDRQNRQLWQAPLANAPAIFPHEDASDPASPFVENGDRLYFFDSAFVTAFDRQTGRVQWRLPASGIHQVQPDSAGHLYVATSTGPGGEPLLYKLDAATGKILWKVDKYDACYVSGRDLYVTRETRNAEDVVNTVFKSKNAIQCRWKLYKLSPRSGEAQWEWFQTRRAVHVSAERKRVALLFPDELQILTSLAL